MVEGRQWSRCTRNQSCHPYMYNLHIPTVAEFQLVVASGKEMEVELIGDMDIVLHCCDEDVVITLRDVAYMPDLWGELIFSMSSKTSAPFY